MNIEQTEKDSASDLTVISLNMMQILQEMDFHQKNQSTSAYIFLSLLEKLLPYKVLTSPTPTPLAQIIFTFTLQTLTSCVT